MKETRNEKTIEELRRELEIAQEAYKSAKEAVKQREVEETERKRVKLAIEKENRKKMLEEKEDELIRLINEYIKDYGSYKNCYHVSGNAEWHDLGDWFLRF